MNPIDRSAATELDPRPVASQQAAGAARRLLRTGAATLAGGGALVLASGLINPGPGLSGVHDATYPSGHLLNGLGYLLMVLGLPVLAWCLGPRLGVAGGIGYVALVVRYVLSTGSQLFQATVYRSMAGHPELHALLAAGGPLSTIYGSHSDQVTLVLAIGLLPLAWALWRADRSLRTPAVLLLVSAVTNVLVTPLALIAISVLVIWLGLRIAIHEDVTHPLRSR